MSQTKVGITAQLERNFGGSKISRVEDTWKFHTKKLDSGQLSVLAYILHEYRAQIDIKRSGLGMTVLIQA